ncbi:MAG: PilZ domain-containing protein [Deltaproteobacteria bacterium]|jgi:hypothetical protein
MKACKVFPSLDDTATIVCPHCGFHKDVDAAKFKNRAGPLKIRCRCQSTFAVSFDFRRAPRKETHLEGYCIRLPECKDCTKILVKDISSTGIGFATVTVHNLRKGDKVRLRFTLDDRNLSEVTKTAIVKWVGKANRVGCEFCDLTHLEQGSRALRCYLMF